MIHGRGHRLQEPAQGLDCMRGVLLLGLLLLAPLAGAQDQAGTTNPNQPTPTTLYFHVINVVDMPINTQEPDAAYEQNFSWGPAATTAGCLADAGAATAPLEAPYNTWYGYSSPNLVEYGFMTNGMPRVHPERGVSYDVLLDAAATFTLSWYVLVTMPVDGEAGALPATVPNLQVRATMRAGESISVDDQAYNSGPILAHGQTQPASMVGEQVVGGEGQVRAVRQVGEAWVYEFAIPMTLDADVIPRAPGFNVRIDMVVDNPVCDNTMVPTFAVHSSKDFRPRMEFSILNPLRIEYLHPQYVGDDLVLHAALNSAWGKYDVPAANLTLAVRGPGQAEFVQQPQQTLNVYPRDTQSYTPTWVWANATQAPPGLYEIQVTATNLQGTAQVNATAAFEVSKPNEAPTLAIGFLALGLLALVGESRGRTWRKRQQP